MYTEASLALALDRIEPFEPPRRTPLRLVPDVLVEGVDKMETEDAAQAEYQRWVGARAVESSAAVTPFTAERQTSSVNLLERLRKAKEGDPEAQASVQLNIFTATDEGFFKDNYIGQPIRIERTADGTFAQHGQPRDSVRDNAVTLRPKRHPILQEITAAEGLNDHRIKYAAEADKNELQDNYVVFFSLVPDGVPEKQLGEDGDGYFLHDLSFSIQASTEEADRSLSVEPAFLAGTEAEPDDSFEDRLAKRHDFAAISLVYEMFNQEAPQTAAELLTRGLKISKLLMPNGVIDVVQWCKEAIDTVKGRQVERPADYYLELVAESRRKSASVAEVRKKVYDDLLAAADRLTTAAEASQLLWDLVKRHGVNASIGNTHIEPYVFGAQAKRDIEQSRYYYERGMFEQSQFFVEQAHKHATLSGCGGGSGGGGGSDKERGFNERLSTEELIEKYGEDKKGALAFYCKDCGYLNDRGKNPRKNGNHVNVKNCGGCNKDVSCGDPNAV